MTRLVLIHWNESEAASKLELLRGYGFGAQLATPESPASLAALARDAGAVLIDLSRLPLQGRAIAIELRRRAASRRVPLVFVGGAPEKVDLIRKLLPDAAYIEWSGVPESLVTAMETAVKAPVVPDTMAGYSGTPLPKKLGIKDDSVVALIGAPDDFVAKLEPLPARVKFVTRAPGADRVMLFVMSMKDFRKRWDGVTRSAADGATVWIAWPKKASGVITDVTDNAVRAHGLENGWVDYKICAIDETWSGLAFARRKASKTGH